MAADDSEDDAPDPENEAVHDLLVPQLPCAGSEWEVEEGEDDEEHSVPGRSNTAADDDEVDMLSDEQEVIAVTATTVRISLASM
jgi:hypothetical protein